MFPNARPRHALIAAAATLLLTGLGYAVRFAEDNQVGESNTVSRMIFALAVFAAYWAVFLGILCLRRARRR